MSPGNHFEGTNFYREYTSHSCENQKCLWECFRYIMVFIYKNLQQAVAFEMGLKADMSSVIQKIQCASEAWMVPVVAVTMWTSAYVDHLGKTWFQHLQHLVRSDVGKEQVMRCVARIWRTMGLFCHICDHSDMGTARRKPIQSTIPWPATWELYRGFRLPAQHVMWFLSMVGGVIYRVSAAVATTPLKDQAIEFMTTFSEPTSAAMALLVLKLDPEKQCIHVNYLERYTCTRNEHEFLFPPYSAFQLESMTKKEHEGMWFWEMVVKVVPDNKLVPERVPVAPWG